MSIDDFFEEQPSRERMVSSRARKTGKTTSNRLAEVSDMYSTLSKTEVSRKGSIYLDNGRGIDYGVVPQTDGIVTVAGLATYLLQQKNIAAPTHEQVVQYALGKLPDLISGIDGGVLRAKYQALFDPTSRAGGNNPHEAHLRTKGSHAPGYKPVAASVPLDDPALDKPEIGSKEAAMATPPQLALSRPYIRPQ